MKKSDLMQKVEEWGVDLQIAPDEKITNDFITFKLGEHYYNNTPILQTWGLHYRLFNITCPMLCFNFKDLKPAEQEDMMKSEDWLAEIKRDGCRLLLAYSPKFGFEAFSRDTSDVSFLPVSYTSKLLFIDKKTGVVRTPDSYKGEFNFNFVIDCEVMADNKDIDTSLYGSGGVTTSTELNATVAILGSDCERARQIQIEQSPLNIYAFDILYAGNKDLRELPLEERKEILVKLLDKIKDKAPIILNEWVTDNKEEFYTDIVNKGGEGIVLKHKKASYLSTKSRNRKVQVKRKRCVSQFTNEDVDVFISGFVPAKKDSLISNLIGGIKVSAYIREEDGTETLHWIGTISGIPMELRTDMTCYDSDGNVSLKPEYLDKVLTVDGQDISSKNLRFSHCRAKSWQFRIDKNPISCVMERSFLNENVL